MTVGELVIQGGPQHDPAFAPGLRLFTSAGQGMFAAIFRKRQEDHHGSWNIADIFYGFTLQANAESTREKSPTVVFPGSALAYPQKQGFSRNHIAAEKIRDRVLKGGDEKGPTGFLRVLAVWRESRINDQPCRLIAGSQLSRVFEDEAETGCTRAGRSAPDKRRRTSRPNARTGCGVHRAARFE